MNHYINFCPKYTENVETLTIDIPTEYMEEVLRLANVLSEEKNITARRAFLDIINGTFYSLIEKNYDRKNRKNKKR